MAGKIWMKSAARLALGGALAATAGAFPAAPALAQVAGEEEIIVTARKREEALFDVPAPISAVTQETISNLRLQDARDVIALVPTAFLQENNAGTARDFSIRGVSTPTLFAEPGVAAYVDEVYSGGFISFPTQFYDIERIEILRGPQGGLYGRNAVGGAVSVISAEPSSEMDGYVRATAARYDRRELEFAANVPFTQTFQARIAGWSVVQDEGEYFNPVSGRYLDASDTAGLRGTLAWRPTENFDLTFLYEAIEADIPGTYLFFPTAGETPDNVARSVHPENTYGAERYVLRANYRTDMGDFTLIYGDRSYDLDGVEDTDLSATGGPFGQQDLTRENTVESQFAEARWLSPEFGPVSLLAGLTYIDEIGTGDVFVDFTSFPGSTFVTQNDQTLESVSAFIEATWTLTDTLSLIGSLRYTEDEKTVDFVYAPTGLVTAVLGAGQSAAITETFDNTSPGLTLSWTPSDAWNLYARVQTGFRAGGYNFNVANVGNLPYEEETSINYEIGAKRRFDAGYVAATAYVLEQEDVLVSLFDLTAPSPIGGYLDNVGEARTIGVELEASVELFEALTLTGAVGWLNAEFTDGFGFGNTPLDGNELPTSREWTGAVTAAYRRAVATNADFVANLSYSYRSDGFQDVFNSTPIEDASLLNFSTGVEFGHVDILAFVTNALDDDYVIATGFNSSSDLGETRAPGQSYGVTARLKW